MSKEKKKQIKEDIKEDNPETQDLPENQEIDEEIVEDLIDERDEKISKLEAEVADLKNKAEALKNLNPSGFQNTIISKMGSLSSVGGAISQMSDMVKNIDTTKFPGNMKLATQISTAAESMGNIGKLAAGGKIETKFADKQKKLEKQILLEKFWLIFHCYTL